MTPRKKPDLSVESGTWINPGFLSERTRRDLADVLVTAKGVDPKLRTKLIDFANDYLQYRSERDEATASICDQLDDVAKKASKLLETLESLSRATIETLAIHAQETAQLGAPPIEPEIAYRITRVDETRFLDAVWDHASALETIAKYAKDTERPSRTDKPDQNQARALVANVALRYMQLTSVVVPDGETILRFGQEWCGGDRVPGEPPPKNPAGWFAEFVGVLGSKMGLEIGPKIVKSGIALALSTPEFNDDER